MPLLTIITPVLNAEKYIEKTILSISIQSCKNFEFILLDGASIDKTLSIARKYDKYINKIITNADNSALDAINTAWPMVAGDYVLYLGGDDWLEPNAVEEICIAAQEHPSIPVIGFGMTFNKEIGGSLLNEGVLFHPDDGVFNIPNAVYGGCVNHVFHRSLFDKFGLYNPSAWGCSADRELQLRFAMSEPKKIVIHKVLYHFRKHSNSATGNGSALTAASNMFASMRIANYYARNADNLRYKNEILKWYGFCWVRASYYHLMTFKIRKFFYIVFNGFVNYPLFCLKACVFYSMPKKYKIKTFSHARYYAQY